MAKSDDLVQEFENSAEQIKNCGKTFNDDTLLKLYGYYKQSTKGDCDIDCPAFWQAKEKAKWEAWNQHRGMKNDHAMKRYIKLVSNLIE